MRVVDTMSSVDASAWDALDHGGSPFLRAAFLAALEDSGSIGPGTGWAPFYLLCEDAGALRGAVAAFVKTDSYGEYIFDWSWANAAERAGLRYYPKLVVAAPFTPATGPRILLGPGAGAEIADLLVDAVSELGAEIGCSSVHWLFCREAEQARLADHDLAPRASFQFHWRNRGYASFDDFLARLKSRKRKQLRKERRRALDAVDSIEWIPGGDLDDGDLAAMDRFYRTTVHDHGGFDYLRPGFFGRLARSMPEILWFARARLGGATVAGAIFFDTGAGLYGRYWGCDESLDFLHFEVAYYAGIERCIERGIPLFEAGAQGEHKLLRGFEPAPTYSAHRMFHPGFDDAIRQFLVGEAHQIAHRMAGLAEYGPYRDDD